MTSDIAIRMDNLGKRYRLGAKRAPYRTLRDVLSRPRLRGAATEEETWVLQNISAEISQGEVVGLIGRNGAGKSTLLKILSRITEPSAGAAEIRGRIGSLLEVGTGFHPELTGRENVFLNGAILGMRKSEIERRFDEIVAFAEVEKFLDTAVKHYSSGMYLRLAFAVAAHLEPEVLLVDEVLAVGDAAFQQKCIGKMQNVAEEGRTVVFVSHNLSAIQALCRRTIVLKKGGVMADGSTPDAIGCYLRSVETAGAQALSSRTDRGGAGRIRLTHVDVYAGEERRSSALATGRDAHFVFGLSAVEPGIRLRFTIYDRLGQAISTFATTSHAPQDRRSKEIGSQIECHIDELALVPGRYRLNVALSSDSQVQDHVEAAAIFTVEQGVLRGRAIQRDSGYGSTCLAHRWDLPI